MTVKSVYPWPEDNIDKTDDWGCFYTGVIIAVARADVTIQTLIYSCRCLCDSQSLVCSYQG